MQKKIRQKKIRFVTREEVISEEQLKLHLYLSPCHDGVRLMCLDQHGCSWSLITIHNDGTLSKHSSIPEVLEFAIDDQGCLVFREEPYAVS